MFEDIIGVETEEKDPDKPYLVRVSQTYSSWNAMEHFIRGDLIARGFEKALASIGIEMAIDFKLMDKRKGEKSPRWYFSLRLEDYEED